MIKLRPEIAGRFHEDPSDPAEQFALKDRLEPDMLGDESLLEHEGKEDSVLLCLYAHLFRLCGGDSGRFVGKDMLPQCERTLCKLRMCLMRSHDEDSIIEIRFRIERIRRVKDPRRLTPFRQCSEGIGSPCLCTFAAADHGGQLHAGNPAKKNQIRVLAAHAAGPDQSHSNRFFRFHAAPP